MKHMEGDIISLAKAGVFDVIIQGNNCFHTMNAGLAKQIKGHFNAAYLADLRTKHGHKGKLGTFSHADIQIGAHTLTVINAYTQFRYGGGVKNADYGAIRGCFREMKKEYGGKNLRFGYPLIGCGLAGGDWGVVKPIIDEELEGEDHTLVVFIR